MLFGAKETESGFMRQSPSLHNMYYQTRWLGDVSKRVCFLSPGPEVFIQNAGAVDDGVGRGASALRHEVPKHKGDARRG